VFPCGITLAKKETITGWLYKQHPIDDPVAYLTEQSAQRSRPSPEGVSGETQCRVTHERPRWVGFRSFVATAANGEVAPIAVLLW
jgi:hypothetical protein